MRGCLIGILTAVSMPPIFPYVNVRLRGGTATNVQGLSLRRQGSHLSWEPRKALHKCITCFSPPGAKSQYKKKDEDTTKNCGIFHMTALIGALLSLPRINFSLFSFSDTASTACLEPKIHLIKIL